jgi:uncharacterized membrane protein
MPSLEVFSRSKRGISQLLLFKILIVAVYLVGIIGMSLPVLRPYFQILTPFHLLFSCMVLLYFHRDFNARFIIFVLLSFTIGFLAEVVGVQYGWIFGEYTYGDVLGFQLLGVPLIIGVNWFMLVYLTGSILHSYIDSDMLAALAGAALMVLVDFLIEPVAIALDFWQWNDETIPLSNYAGWFGVAFALHLFFRKLKFTKDNPISIYLLLAMVIFFTSLVILI